MSDVFYTPPAAELMDPPKKGSAFFTVSVTKLTVMLIMTSGLYGIYWSFKNWSHYKAYSGRPIWPIPRALFGLIYLPSLFYKVDAELKTQGRRLPYWAALAAGLILLFLAPSLIGFLIGLFQGLTQGTYTGLGVIPAILASTIPFLLQCLILRTIQSFINLANGDAEGSRNKDFTRWNVLWMAIGVIYWIAGIMLTISMNQSPL